MFGVKKSGQCRQNSKFGKSERCHKNNFAGRAAALSMEPSDLEGHGDALVARGGPWYYSRSVFVFVFFKFDEKYK